MECKDKYVQRVVAKYNRRHVTAFVRRGAEKKYLKPFGLSLRTFPPKNFGNAKGLLRREEEFQLFTALHYMKWKIGKTRHKCKERYLQIYLALRNRAITANWPLVLNCVRRHAEGMRNGTDCSELREKGYLCLIRAVDGFDPWMGCRFSTYACNAITRSFYDRVPRHVPFSTIEEIEEIAPLPAKEDSIQGIWLERLKRLMQTDVLTLREKQILHCRFMEGLTLKEVGKLLELTKERIRQLQFEALDKLKAALKVDSILQ